LSWGGVYSRNVVSNDIAIGQGDSKVFRNEPLSSYAILVDFITGLFTLLPVEA
jgi:hypothetical protein